MLSRWLPILLLCGLVGVAAEPERERIRLGSVPTLSPDGSSLVFHWGGDLWRVASTGGRAEALTRHPAADDWACFSPDGTRIAFVSRRDGYRRVYTMPAHGGTPVPVTWHTDGSTPLDWSPDGQSLLVAGSRDRPGLRPRRLLQVRLDGQGPEKLLFDAYADWGQWSPDGSQILFVREGAPLYRRGYRGSKASQIWLYDLESGDFTLLCNDPMGARRPLWRPDGAAFYYLNGTSGCFNLWLYDLETQEQRQLTRFTDAPVTIPSISEDGTTIVFRQLFDFHRYHPGTDAPPERIDIWHDTDRFRIQHRRRWYKTPWNNDAWGAIEWSPDGLEIAFTTGGDLWVMDTVLKEPVQVIGNSGTQETDVVWLPEGKGLLVLSDVGDRVDILKVTRTDHKRSWWQNREFDVVRVNSDTSVKSRLSLSPDGKVIAFVRDGGQLCVAQPDLGNLTAPLKAWRCYEYDWSPDSKWLACAARDSARNSDVWIVPSDGSRESYNVTRHPDWDGDPRWAPNGDMLAFRSQRGLDKETDIHHVRLTRKAEEEDTWHRTLREAVGKMATARKPKPAPKKPSGKAKPPPKPVSVTIDFEGLSERVQRLSLADSRESALVWGSKGAELFFSTTIKGRKGTYSVTFPDKLEPQFRASETGHDGRAKGNGILWRSGNKIAKLVGAKNTFFDFAAYQTTELVAYRRLAFLQIWRTMRDRFHDPNMNNLDWDGMRSKYEAAAAGAADRECFARIVAMLLGELNASHMGYTQSHSEWKEPEFLREWNVRTEHLGLRFDPGHVGPGLKVRSVIWRGPADRVDSRILPGETVLSIDGTPVSHESNVARLLTGMYPRTSALRVADKDGAERDVNLRGTSYGEIRKLEWEAWVEGNRETVERVSQGRLSYLHIGRMRWPEFRRFEREVFALGYGKEGLVIDVRNNGGGLTADHLLTILARPAHALTIPRGGDVSYPRDYLVYASWDKPIVVLCNQYSESNSEIFCHAVKGLGRGKIVGVPTAGNVIATGSRKILDLGTLRVPERTWFNGIDGRDMELGGVQPDIVIWPRPGELPAGDDRQLQKAVEVLLAEADDYKRDAIPELKRASTATD